MPLFFFDFYQGEMHSPDPNGFELASADEAFLEGFKTAEEMWGELLAKRQDPRRCRFEILDDQHSCLFVLPFQEVLESCRDGRPPASFLSTYRAGIAHATRAQRVAREFRDTLTEVRRNLDDVRRLIAIVR